MCKNKLYFALQVMPSTLPTKQKATAMLKLEAYHQGLIKVINALIHINNTLAFWPYKSPNLLESGLLTTPSALGSLTHQILHYFDEFRINKELLMSYVHCLIGFDMDYDQFMSSAMGMLADVLAKIYKHSIQVPHITSLGWLFGTYKDSLLPSFETLLHDMVKLLAPNQSPPIQFGLTYKPIYNGTPCSERAKIHSCGNWAVHVEAITEIALTSKAYLKKALLSLAIKAHTNLPLLLVPILQKRRPPVNAKISNALSCATLRFFSPS